ncbi:Vacuolar protein-sorting-associated protein 24, partial [Clydaea vesicula]
KLTPEELVKKWRASVRTQERQLDRQIRQLETEENKVKKSMQQLAKANDVKSCTVLAKEVVRARKAKNKM